MIKQLLDTKFILRALGFASISVIMTSSGYGVATWQWWAIEVIAMSLSFVGYE